MARKTSKLPTRIWSFGALQPVDPDQRKLLSNTLFISNRYYNQLVEVERATHAERAQAEADASPELGAALDQVAALTTLIDALYQEVKDQRAEIYRATADKTDAIPEDIQERLDIAKAERKTAWAAVSAARKKLHAEHSAANSAMKATKSLAKKSAANGAGITGPHIARRINLEVDGKMAAEEWPQSWKRLREIEAARVERRIAQRRARPVNALQGGLVEAAIDVAVKDSFPDAVRFRRSDGTGRVGGQIVGGIAAERLLTKGCGPLHFAPQRDAGYYVVSVNVGGGAEPRWVDLRVRLHRQIPDDAIVKYAWVLVRRVGARLKYQLQLTMESATFGAQDRGGRGNVDVRFGWAARDEGLCLARWQGDDGKGGELVFPDRLVQRNVHAIQLGAYADSHLAMAVRVLRRWLGRNGHVLHGWQRAVSLRFRHQLAAFVTNAAEAMIGKRRCSELWQQWKSHRLGSRDVQTGEMRPNLFVPLNVMDRWSKTHDMIRPEDRLVWWLFVWARKDAHLEQYAADQQRRFDAQRNAFYRDAAIALARRYATFTANLVDWSAVAKRKEIGKESDEILPVARRNRVIASPGRCEEIFYEVFGQQRPKKGAKNSRERSGDEENPGGARGSEIKKGNAESHVVAAAE